MRLGLSTKLLTIFVASVALLSLAALYGLWSGWRALQDLHVQEDLASSYLESVHTLQIRYQDEIHEWKNVLLRGDTETLLQQKWQIYENAHQEAQTILQALIKQPLPGPALDKLAQFDRLHRENRQRYLEATDLLRQGQFKEDYADQHVKGIDRPVMKLLTEAHDLTEQFFEKASDQLIAEAETRMRIALGLFLLAGAIGAALFMYLGKRIIANPTRHLVNELSKIEHGDFLSKINKKYNDEIGDIAESIQHMVITQGTLIAHVKATAQRLAENARQVAGISSMTSEGIRNQRHETQQAELAMQEMSRFLQDAASSTETAVSAAEQIKTHSENITQSVHQAAETTQTLAGEARQTADALQSLKDEAQRIDASVLAIRNIAEQTNMLALNAAIEAARAGEAGRGFAVVADEVRKLAQNTQAATTDIEQRIQGLQQGVERAMINMLNECQRAEQSAEHAAQAQQMLSDIMRVATMIRDVNTGLAHTLIQQERTAQNIGQAIVNIGQVVEQTAFSSESAAHEVSKVADEAELTRELFERFQVPLYELPEFENQHGSRENSSGDIELF